jgi:hypothetical protein
MDVKMGKAIISLCDLSGVMVKPWAEAGFQCYCVDTAHSIRRDRVEGNVTYCWGDVRSWSPPDGVRPAMIFAFPPCTDLAVSGARDFAKKSWPMLRDGMDLFFATLQAAKWAGCPYMIENPVGRIAGIHHPATHTFDPCDYGDPYTKKTCLWTGGGFVMPPKNRVEPTLGSMMHTLPPSQDRQSIRSQTPEGFARAVFEANSQILEATSC